MAKRLWTQEEIAKMKKLYLEDGMILRDIGKLFGTKAGTVSRLLKEANVEIKRRGLTKNRTLREDYFVDIDSPTKAYFLGFLFADGSVGFRNRQNSPQGVLSLELSTKDIELINTLCKELNANNKLFYRASRDTVAVKISSTKLVNSLMKFSIIPNKTYLVNHLPFNEIPDKYHIDFIRGLIDGDGSIYLINGTARLEFCSYSYEIVEELQNYINNLIGNTRPNKITYSSCYYARWTSQSQVDSILKILYSNDNIALTRKKELALAIIR